MPKAKKNSLAIQSTDGRKHNGRKQGTKVVKNRVKKLTPAKLNKAKKERIQLYSINAIREEFGSEEVFFQHLAKESKKSYNHLKLMMEYAYGKPEDNQVGGTQNKAPIINFFGNPPAPAEETIDITSEEDS